MKHELIESITSEQLYIDLNDEYIFKPCVDRGSNAGPSLTAALALPRVALN